MKSIVLFALATFIGSSLFAKDPTKVKNNPKDMVKPHIEVNPMTLVKNVKSPVVDIFDHEHKAFTKILNEYVVVAGPVTSVKYGKMKKSTLVKYLSELSVVKQKQFEKWTRDQQMSFLINAYNAFTIQLILDNYPVKSIKKIGGFFSSPWKKEFFTLLGKKRHLDWIEHEVLRKKYKDPRIHFAVNCASIGCPALRNEAFIAKSLEKQLEEQTKLFLKDTNRNKITSKSLEVSKIFDWFEEDFVKSSGSVESFVAKYMTDDISMQNKIQNKKLSLKFTKYDWNLNDAK